MSTVKTKTNSQQKFQLVKSDTFYDSEANFYRDISNDTYMTVEQITNCLGYRDVRGVYKLLERHPYLKELKFSVFDRMTSTDGKTYETRLINEFGIYEITFLSHTKKSKEFRWWVGSLLKQLRKGDLQIGKDDVFLTSDVINAKFEGLFNTMAEVQISIKKQNQTINKINKSTSRTETMIRPLVPKSRPYSTWKSLISDKLNSLVDEVDIDGKEILRNIYAKMRLDYDIDVNLYSARYVADHPEDNPLNGLDTVDYYDELHEPFKSILDNYKELILVKT